MGIFTGSWTVCYTAVTPIVAYINSLTGTSVPLSTAGFASTTYGEALDAVKKAQLKYCIIDHCKKTMTMTTWK